MVSPAFGSRSDVHPRTFPNRFEPLQDGNVAGFVGMLYALHFGMHFSRRSYIIVSYVFRHVPFCSLTALQIKIRKAITSLFYDIYCSFAQNSGVLWAKTVVRTSRMASVGAWWDGLCGRIRLRSHKTLCRPL